ncbi:MAG TPA: putative sugar nucleotidyl transferase [Gemmatimonadaceae bacterium]|nr:putative sugar nucleotidyl transferase [Gemmatimonadaceae bacterium]
MTTHPLYLYDDARARAFEPFALTRPAGELRAGAEIVRRRWERALGARAAGFIGAPHLATFEELDAPPAAGETLPAGAIIANSRCIPSLRHSAEPASGVWWCDGRVAAVRLPAPLEVAPLADGVVALEAIAPPSSHASRGGAMHGWWADEVWHYLRDLSAQLADDVPHLAATLELDEIPAHATTLGEHAVHVERGATIEPFVVLDATAGPILVRRGTVVQSFTRIAGPCYVGEGSTIVGDRVSGCSIGDVCKVRGEISASIVLGHTNKGHDGFVGHSYLGRWVNLGAGTTTSNLKNTYGAVALWTPDGVRDTGMQFLGTLFGDHAKTGIGLRLTTGTVVGAGANIYGSQMPPKAVPPFAWGDGAPYDSYAIDKFVRVAERAMSRRHVALGDGARRTLAVAHALARESASW